MTDVPQRGTPAPQHPQLPAFAQAHVVLDGLRPIEEERMNRLAAEFSLEFGPLLNVLDFAPEEESEPTYTSSMGERARWEDA